MKKIGRFIRSNIKVLAAFILGGIVLGGFGVYAAVASSSISYSNSASGLSATTVQGAIDELNTKATTKIEAARKECPSGYNCTQNYTCSGSSCKKCVRATSLHTEVCTQTSTSNYCGADGYSVGSGITYGSTGKSGTFTTGDAFDCDVNGDGIYNSLTERFYYVTDMNTSTAVLIYYNNVSGGVASNSTSYAYNSGGTNSNGPVTAITQLPTTTQWKNVSLTNSTRNLTDNVGTVKVTGFNYGNKAARFLTYQEIEAGCYDGTNSLRGKGGLSSKCKFLMENTKYSNTSMKTYGGWLETPDNSINSYAWYIYSSNRSFGYDFGVNWANGIGVRPAIEVAKSNISY